MKPEQILKNYLQYSDRVPFTEDKDILEAIDEIKTLRDKLKAIREQAEIELNDLCSEGSTRFLYSVYFLLKVDDED